MKQETIKKLCKDCEFGELKKDGPPCNSCCNESNFVPAPCEFTLIVEEMLKKHEGKMSSYTITDLANFASELNHTIFDCLDKIDFQSWENAQLKSHNALLKFAFRIIVNQTAEHKGSTNPLHNMDKTDIIEFAQEALKEVE